MFSSWWDFEEVCASCAKSARSFVLCLKLAQNSVCIMCLIMNSNIVISKLQCVCHTQSCDPPRGLEIIWGMSNMVISKLRGVCRTQSCDPLRGLEIIWGLKMSKLLNLIAYSLACLLTCTNWILSCICEHLANHASRIFVALFEMVLASLYMSVLVEIGVFMLMVNLLNLLIHFMSYLSSWLLA
jgi:hypothetical protein